MWGLEIPAATAFARIAIVTQAMPTSPTILGVVGLLAVAFVLCALFIGLRVRRENRRLACRTFTANADVARCATPWRWMLCRAAKPATAATSRP